MLKKILQFLKKFFKGCLWSILGIIILGVCFILFVIYTTKRDEKKVAEIEKLWKQGPVAVPELLKYLDDKDGSIRYEAIYRLNDFRDTRTLMPLIKELKTSDNEVPRKWAAQALGTLGNTTAVIPLIDALNDSSFHVRYKSADALGKIGDRRAIEPLRKMAAQDEYEYARIYAQNALIDIFNKYYNLCSKCHKDIYQDQNKDKKKWCFITYILDNKF